MATRKPIRFDASILEALRVNQSYAEMRAATLGTRRSWKKEAQAAVLVRILQCLDLTTLAGSDTPDKVKRLARKGLNPVDHEVLTALGLSDLNLTVGALCVYPAQVQIAVEAVQGRIPIASVATGFPAGQTPLRAKLAEIQDAILAGAKEIDVVISRGLALDGKWRAVCDELVAFREICGESAKMKVILGVGDLGTLLNVAKASVVAILAGADTIKTSTGFEPSNATLEASLVMVRMIRHCMDLKLVTEQTGLVGFKPAGGIKTAGDAMKYMTLMFEELDERWTHPNLMRFGASGLALDLNRQLYHLATGRYAAERHQAVG